MQYLKFFALLFKRYIFRPLQCESDTKKQTQKVFLYSNLKKIVPKTDSKTANKTKY